MEHRVCRRSSRVALVASFVLAACGGSSYGGGGGSGGGDGYGGDGGGGGGGTAATALWVIPESAPALTSDGRAAFTAGGLYYNAHTAANTGGEIRGQLDHGGTLRLATLDGAQETPPVTTGAFGAGAFTVDTSTGRIRGLVTTSGLVNATAAHVHLGARGSPGGIIVPLSGGPEVWVVPDGAAQLTSEQIDAFERNDLFVNVHTSANPAGEIRGQLDKGGTVQVTSLSGGEETPPVTTSGFGAGILVVDDTTGVPGGFIVASGLTGANAAHVHLGAKGTPGGVILPLSGGPGLWVVPDGAGALTAEQRTAFAEKNLYYNVHTAANPGGEIRGQLEQRDLVRIASLDGGQEVPAVTTTAFGAGLLALDDGTSGEVGGFLLTVGLVAPNAAHVHSGSRGTPGGVLVPLSGP
ncbi:CHRD domain-containing protein [Anaeromyxobacter sp. Fw109-5]|uniref:CHRD domain-containing protein n=1 Tax=Anaeromyxobacter sp. (strain Fw109-5) TaxID=404589 RepID=UPI0000ED78A8|nr:CHRD domain-containing protein [Anaeromyxobacter sp. Fw109-5]ABS24795.1 CHRD domain containing protein [Anaeromyxobacter sp. Fw109-5]